MRILLATPYYLPSVGGLERHVNTLARSLTERSSCAILTSNAGETTSATSTQRRSLYKSSMLAPGNTNVSLREASSLFDSVINDFHPDIILAHNLHQWISPYVCEGMHLSAGSAGVPLVLRLHNHLDGHRSVAMLRDLPWAHLVPVSKSVGNQLSRYGIASHRISVVPPPVDTLEYRKYPSSILRDALGIRPKQIVTLQVSRIMGGADTIADKGIDRLIQVIAEIPGTDYVLAHPPSANAILEATAVAQIRELAKHAGCESRVHLYRTNPSTMADCYNSADIYAALPTIEAFGLTYIEAAACSIPAIGSNIGGVPDAIVDGLTGFLVNGDQEAIDAMKRLIHSAHLRERCGRAAADWTWRHFKAEMVAEKVHALLEQTIAGAYESHL